MADTPTVNAIKNLTREISEHNRIQKGIERQLAALNSNFAAFANKYIEENYGESAKDKGEAASTETAEPPPV